MPKEWLLSSDNFTLRDRLKIAGFILNKNNQLTMGPKVAEFENKMGQFAGVQCIGTSSGSTAIELVFQLFKIKNPKLDIKNKAIVICPAVTWASSITPALMMGYNIEFCDINLNDFSFDYKQLESLLKKHKSKKIIIWTTALIGFCPDFTQLISLKEKYDAELWGDFCENTLSNYNNQSIFQAVNISVTSCYFSHEITAIEFGFVFLKDKNDYDLAKMLRNHGLTRSLEKNNNFRLKIEKQNPTLDPLFLFGVEGTNWRPTDLHAMWGLQDFNRIHKYKQHRKFIYDYYHDLISPVLFYLPPKNDGVNEHIAFCLPIFSKLDKLKSIKELLNTNKIHTRPIIGSNLVLQPPFKKYYKKMKNAQWVHEHGCYVGLHYDTTTKDIDRLVSLLNYV